jgi:hypothetical protein
MPPFRTGFCLNLNSVSHGPRGALTYVRCGAHAGLNSDIAPCLKVPIPEVVSFHSITSSARATNASGSAKPRAFAVFRLITNSNLVGACTGRSAGFSPLRMRST